MLYLPVLAGTVRHEATTPHVARWVAARLAERPGVETRVFDPRDLPFAQLEVREWEMEPRPPGVEEFVREMGRADGFVLVFPEYNHGYPGAIKDVLDHVYDEWNRKAFGLVTTGGISGGIRAQEQMRLVVNALQGAPVPVGVPIPWTTRTWGPDGPLEDDEAWRRRFARFFDDLEWWARALRRARVP